MLSKEEQRQLNYIFWNGFQERMKKIKSSNGLRMNWINYPTDLKEIQVRCESDKLGARLCFDIQPKEDSVRAIIYEQMTELKVVLEECMQFETNWLEDFHLPTGKTISRISWELTGVNFYNESHHEQIYEFLKERLITFDEFYQDYKDLLIALIK